MSGRTRIARRELAALRSEKTIVLAIGIQLFIAAFSSFLLVGLVSMYDPGSVSGGEITIGVTGDAGDDLADAIRGGEGWQVERFPTERAAREAFRNPRSGIETVFIADRLPNDIVNVEVLVPEESVRSTVIVVQVREALQAYERARRDELSSRLSRQPVPLPDVPDGSPTFTFTYTVLIPLLVVLPAFISGSVAADTITEEVDAGTLPLLRVTPLSAAEIVDGKMLATIGLAPLQTAAWLALLRFNGTAIANPIEILGFVAALATILVSVGVGLALRFEDRQSSQLLYSLLVLLVFGIATLLPESPPNTVAKLALGSASSITYVILLGYLAVAAAAFLTVRRGARRAIEA